MSLRRLGLPQRRQGAVEWVFGGLFYVRFHCLKTIKLQLFGVLLFTGNRNLLLDFDVSFFDVLPDEVRNISRGVLVFHIASGIGRVS